MKESELIKRLLLEAKSSRLFRNNTGLGWQGKCTPVKAGKMIIFEPRPLRAGLVKGSSDIIGWTPVEITPEMVGKKVAVFTAVEAKTGKGRLTKEQAVFLKVLKECGGIAGVARSPEDINSIINDWIHDRHSSTQE